MAKQVILVGGFHELIELCEIEGYLIEGIIDNNLLGEYWGYPILGKDENAKELFKEYGSIPLIISPDSPSIRKKLVNHYASLGYQFETLISSEAKISKSAIIGKGTVVQAGVYISSNANIGQFTKLNVRTSIMHDVNIDNYATVAPCSLVLGRVHVGESAYIGANSTILPNINIGTNTVIGAGAVVTRNISDHLIVKGIPAK